VQTSSPAIAPAKVYSPVISQAIKNVSVVATHLHVIVFKIERLGVLVFTITILLTNRQFLYNYLRKFIGDLTTIIYIKVKMVIFIQINSYVCI
jgi:hypothetical protein